MMGTEQTRVPTGRVPAVSGPCSTISAQNSWPNTQSAAGSSAGTPDRAHEPGEVREVGQRVQVGAADAGGQRAHHDVARRRNGFGHIAHHQLSTPGHRGPHGTTPRTAGGAAARIVATFAR